MLNTFRVCGSNLFFAICFALIAGGCGETGPRNCAVSGTVTIDGKPVPQGSIEFDPVVEGDLPGGAVIVDGQYSTKLSPGKKRVRLSGVDPDAEADETTGLVPQLIPDKYTETPPEVDIQGNATHNFELTSN